MSRVRSLLARGPRAFDAALAGLFVAGTVVELLLLDAPAGDRVVVLACDLGLAGLVFWRRRIPAVGLVAFAAALLITRALGDDTANQITLPFIALFVFAYALGAYGSLRATVVGSAIAVVGVGCDIVINEETAGAVLVGLLFASIFMGAPLAVGRAMRNRRLLADALREKAERAERDQEADARRAVEGERARIARELHDVVAHSISVMTVQAEAVARIADRYPEQARSSLETIENTGREALTEMRRLLGVLRRDDDVADLAPQPSLAQVGMLADRARVAGLDVELRVEGEQRHLSAGVDLVAYRVVQEALGDALARAGARRARVTVRYGERNVRIEVFDDGAAFRSGGETGELLGMRERVGLYGGDLEAGPAGHGHAVRVRLPLDLVSA
ncbi:MAG: histidine kinase [Actinomycetota bacterium]|nr:histidine kinase [Actinomycetota bacterium]